MNVQDYLEMKRREARAKKIAEQRAVLQKLNLFDIVYAPGTEPSVEYPEKEVNEATGEVRYYKKVPARITDEQYAEICSYNTPEKAKNSLQLFSGDVVALLLFAAGITVYALGIVLGILFGKQTVAVSLFEVRTQFSIWIALLYWLSGFAIGTLFIGLAKIVQLLENRNM